MDCNAYREAISARIDGEDQNLPTGAVDAHVASCPACRAWADSAVAVTRMARVAVAEAIPDLTPSILAAVPPTLRRWAAPAAPAVVARLGLVMVAAAQLFVAVPALLGRDPGASIHVAHEQGSWFLALAVGLLVVAFQPRRAAALVPVVAALAGCLAVTMAVDIAAGRTQAAAEAPHGLAFVGLGLLWLLSRRVGPVDVSRRGRSPRTARAA